MNYVHPVHPAHADAVDRALGAIAMAIHPRALVGAGAATHLQHDLQFDSLDRVVLACELEDAHDNAVTDAEAADWETVADVARTIERLIAMVERRA